MTGHACRVAPDPARRLMCNIEGFHANGQNTTGNALKPVCLSRMPRNGHPCGCPVSRKLVGCLEAAAAVSHHTWCIVLVQHNCEKLVMHQFFDICAGRRYFCIRILVYSYFRIMLVDRRKCSVISRKRGDPQQHTVASSCSSVD